MAEKIICSKAKIAWHGTPSSPVSVFTDKKISYESSISDDDGGGYLKTETVTMVILSKNFPSVFFSDPYKWFILTLLLGDGTTKTVGSRAYPCVMERKETDTQVTLTFTVKSPLN